jgi:uncharacterized protein (DUF2141 family)
MITQMFGIGIAAFSVLAVAMTTQEDTEIQTADELPTYTLFVDVRGARPNEGQVAISLFDSEARFLEIPRKMETVTVNADGRAAFAFTDLEEGRYAAIATYDRNGDGELNTGFFGIPTEPVGYSNNVRRIGPPRWRETNFVLRDETSITIHVSRVSQQGDE